MAASISPHNMTFVCACVVVFSCGLSSEFVLAVARRRGAQLCVPLERRLTLRVAVRPLAPHVVVEQLDGDDVFVALLLKQAPRLAVWRLERLCAVSNRK